MCLVRLHVLFWFFNLKKLAVLFRQGRLLKGTKGPSLVAVHGFLTAVLSLVTEHGLWGTWAQQLWYVGLVT